MTDSSKQSWSRAAPQRILCLKQAVFIPVCLPLCQISLVGPCKQVWTAGEWDFALTLRAEIISQCFWDVNMKDIPSLWHYTDKNRKNSLSLKKLRPLAHGDYSNMRWPHYLILWEFLWYYWYFFWGVHVNVIIHHMLTTSALHSNMLFGHAISFYWLCLFLLIN